MSADVGGGHATGAAAGEELVDEVDEFDFRVQWALEGAADVIECGGVGSLGAIVPGWLLERIDESTVERFGRAARELAEQIGAGLWDHSLPRCTADELLLHHCIDVAVWSASDLDGVDCTADADAAREALFMDEDVLLFWLPDAEVAFAGGRMHDAVPDLPSTDPARWFDRFVTTGEDRADP
jgi:hypothetical protein